MSMANSLESRVPFADPRMAKFAFKIGFNHKMRGGATKWLLRQAVADVIPAEVLNRRKAGFDTPAERWLKGAHAGFAKDLLLSARARTRGYWQANGIEAALARTSDPYWFDLVWKLVSIEAWARNFLDGEMVRVEEIGSAQRDTVQALIEQYGTA
jgi:asparagine synthase (glutamine-hydrolysing)